MKNLWILGVVLLGSCSTEVKIVDRIEFPAKEYDNLSKQGNSVITGKAYIRLSEDEIHYPKDSDLIRLNPKTSYSKQWYDTNYKNDKNIGEADPRYFKYIYSTKTDKEGNFRFDNIPAGTYYLSAPIWWTKEVRNPDGSVTVYTLGEFICYEITVNDNQTIMADIKYEKESTLVKVGDEYDD